MIIAIIIIIIITIIIIRIIIPVVIIIKKRIHTANNFIMLWIWDVFARFDEASSLSSDAPNTSFDLTYVSCIRGKKKKIPLGTRKNFSPCDMANATFDVKTYPKNYYTCKHTTDWKPFFSRDFIFFPFHPEEGKISPLHNKSIHFHSISS